jgi:hypothetical protein
VTVGVDQHGQTAALERPPAAGGGVGLCTGADPV